MVKFKFKLKMGTTILNIKNAHYCLFQVRTDPDLKFYYPPNAMLLSGLVVHMAGV